MQSAASAAVCRVCARHQPRHSRLAHSRTHAHTRTHVHTRSEDAVRSVSVPREVIDLLSDLREYLQVRGD